MTLIDLARAYDIVDLNEFRNFKKMIKKKLNFNATSDTMILSEEYRKEIENYLRHCYRHDLEQENAKSQKTGEQIKHTKSKPNRTVRKKSVSENNPEKKKQTSAKNKRIKNNAFQSGFKAGDNKEINLGSYSGTVNILKECVKNKYIVLLDTCVFLETPVEKLIDNILGDIFLEANMKYTVPAKVIKELEKLSESNNDERKKRRSAFCLNFINKGVEGGLIDILSGAVEEKIQSNSCFADPYIYNIVEEKLLFEKRNILVLTKDSRLMNDILTIKNLKSIKYKANVMVKSVSPKGHLCNVIDLIKWDKMKKQNIQQTAGAKV